VPKFVRIQQKNLADVAGQVASALGRGVAVVPMLGGYCVLTREPETLAGFCGPYRLVTPETLEAETCGTEPLRRGRVLKAMAGPLVGRFVSGQPGLALASEPLTREIIRRIEGEIWFGVPADSAEPGELADELGKLASIVVTGGTRGPGPTSVDFSVRPAVIDRRGKLAILHLEEELGELVRMGPGLFFSVLVVCTGNSCRSPMAQSMLAKMLEGTPALVFSAGTDAPVGGPATAQAVGVMREVNLDLTRHRAQQLVPAMVETADLVLVMEDYHRQRVAEMVPDVADRTRLLLTFVGRDEPVGDPVGLSVECYRLTREVMKPALERIAAEIRQRTGRQEPPESAT
jgi:protein-tyrosine phosphatase